jgi:hypothetical protein
MPNPRKQGESEETFIARCMNEIADEYPDNSQRYAVCKTYLSKTNEKMKKQELYVLVPRKAENRGKYLSRCSSNPKIKEQMSVLKDRLAYCLTSFNEYYKYWVKMDEFAEVPANTALGDCIAKEKAKGFDYKEAYAHCASKVVVQPGPVVLSDDNLLVEPVMFGDAVSIDFDDTLNTEKGKQLAMDLIDSGVDLHIITRRNKNQSGEVYDVAEELGIPKDKIHFTGGKLKWEMIKALGITKHIDNNPDELDAIKENLPGVKTTKFAGLEDACWEGYEAIGLKDDGSPNCVPIKMTADDFAETINDYPQGVKDAAKRALDYAEKNGWGGCGTGVGKQRANQLAKGENISVDTLKRMYSYLSRHKVDLQSSKEYSDGCGKLMYDSWGGEAGLSWSEKKLNQLAK